MFLSTYHFLKFKKKLNMRKWSTDLVKCPTQKGGVVCGLFTLAALVAVCLGRPRSMIKMETVDQFRVYICYQILKLIRNPDAMRVQLEKRPPVVVDLITPEKRATVPLPP